jgi:hypothetical protein
MTSTKFSGLTLHMVLVNHKTGWTFMQSHPRDGHIGHGEATRPPRTNASVCVDTQAPWR